MRRKKVDAQTKDEIRTLYATEQYSQHQLAAKFDVDRRSIRRIVTQLDSLPIEQGPGAPSVTLPSWATPCDSEQLCEVDGLPIIATMRARVSPIAPGGYRPNSKSHEFRLCAICLLWEMRTRGELSYEDAYKLTEQLREKAVPVEAHVTHISKPYRKRSNV